MIFRKLLKANVLRVALVASSVALMATRCTAPMPCYAHPIVFDDNAQDSSQETAERPLESDPMDFSYLDRKRTQRESSGQNEPYDFKGTVTRTDGLPNSQPVQSYFVQPFRGRSQSVTCVQTAPGIQSCN